MRASLLPLALLVLGLLAVQAAATVNGWVTGVTGLEELAVLNPPSSKYALRYVYPLETGNSSIVVVMAFYGSGLDRAVYRVYRFGPSNSPHLLGEASATGTPLQPIALDKGRLLIGGASAKKGELDLYVWDAVSGRVKHVASLRLSGNLVSSTGFQRDGKVYLLLTIAKSTGKDGVRVFKLYTLDAATWRVLDETLLPVNTSFTRRGERVDTIYWNNIGLSVKASSQVRGLAAPVIGYRQGAGVVAGIYAIVPRPEENRVIVLHAAFNSRGKLLAEHHYVFRGATWGRLYAESLSQQASAVEEFSQTLLIALHWDGKNRYLAIGGVDGLVGVYSHELGFARCTGASAGTLGLLWNNGEKGMLLLDTLGNAFRVKATFSLIVKAARLSPERALIVMQDRPTRSSYGKITIYTAAVKPNPSAKNDLYGTRHVVRWTTLEKPLHELVTTTAMTTSTTSITTTAVETETVIATSITGTGTATPLTSTSIPQPAIATAKTTAATTVATTAASATTTVTTVAQSTAPPTTALTTAAEKTEAGRTPWLEVLKPGDWVLYRGYVEANGRRAEFSFKIRIVNVDREGVEVEYVEVNVPGVGQGVPVVGNARTGLQWRYEAGSEPACGVVGLNLFTLWTDPRALPADGVVRGEGYRCRYDTVSGLLLEYDATYSFFGSRQHVHYSLADTSVKGLAGGGGLLGGKGLLLVAAVGAAVAAVSLLVLARRS